MENYVWYVIQRETNGKFYAHAFRLRTSQNLAAFVRDYPGVISMNACDTKTLAFKLANAWNDSFRKNGTYMFPEKTF